MISKKIVLCLLSTFLISFVCIAEDKTPDWSKNKYIVIYGSYGHGEPLSMVMFLPVEYCEKVYTRLPEKAKKELFNVSSSKYFNEKTVIDGIKEYPGNIIIPSHLNIYSNPDFFAISFFIEDYGLICQGLLDHVILIYDTNKKQFRKYKTVSYSDREMPFLSEFMDNGTLSIDAFWDDAKSFEDNSFYHAWVWMEYL